jgi:hypothetical protein
MLFFKAATSHTNCTFSFAIAGDERNPSTTPREPGHAHALRCPKDSSLEQLSEQVGRSTLLQVAVDFI